MIIILSHQKVFELLCWWDEINYVDDSTSEGKSCSYKTKIVGKTELIPPRPAQPPPKPDGSWSTGTPQPQVPPLSE